MGKAKKKESKPKKNTVKKINPFELKFNRLKHHVLGQKQNAGVMGRPGLSKKRANEQREKTLGIEHSRVGVVVDKRLGEKDDGKSLEEKASMRFTAERMKNYNKVSKYNLADDDEETLTHGGEALTLIQKYDRTRGSDDEEDGEGNIGAQMVKMAHFGGGGDSQGKSRKDLITDLIAKTKQARQEKAMAKDDQTNLTESLDEKYRKLLGKISSGFRPVGATKNEMAEKEGYDRLVLQMKYDSDQKATPTERTKSEEEKAADEKARLEELENSRLARMNAKENSKRHLPVDVDIDPDAPDKSRKKKKAGFELRFDESGQVLNKDKIEKNSLRKVAIDSDASDEEEEIDDDDDEDLEDLLNGEGESGEENENDSENEEETDNDEDEGDETEDEEDEEDTLDDDDEIIQLPEMKTAKRTATEVNENNEVPFVFDFPSNYEVLSNLFKKYGPKHVGIILERITKCHHPGLKEGNKDLMKKLFLYVLRFYDEVSKEDVTEEVVEYLGNITKSLYIIMKFNVEYSVRCVRAFIRQVWKAKSEEKRKKPASFTVIALLRLVAALFPVSDIWHPVCSPAFMLATSVLANGLITSTSAVAQQILLVTTIVDYIQESKRYVPEVIGFIQGALTLAVEKPDSPAPSNAFPISEPHCQMLLIQQTITSDEALKPLKLREIYDNTLENNDINRCRILRVLLGCIQRLRVMYAVHEETFTTVFSPIVTLMKKVPTSLLPSSLADDLEVLIRSTEAECNARSKVIQLSRIKTEKSMLKMLEPKYEWDFDPERPRISRNDMKKGAGAQKQKLQKLYKKEMRGAVREIRKDGAFLGRKQRQEVASKDRDRKQKTKRLMAELQSQQGDWNKELREDGKKRKK